jgi:cytochrome c biogenesis protein CcmG/thiol:disulfide interchange protein DsbE
MKKFLIPIMLFAALGLLLAYGLRLDPKKIPSPLIDKPLPAFSLPTLDDPGRIITNDALKGRPVLINVWASWCTACRDEHPLLVELSRSGIVQIIGLNYKDQPNDARGILERDGNPYSLILVDADGRTGIDWGVYGVPETFVVDRDGIIRYKHIGPITPEALRETIEPLIRKLSG